MFAPLPQSAVEQSLVRMAQSGDEPSSFPIARFGNEQRSLPKPHRVFGQPSLPITSDAVLALVRFLRIFNSQRSPNVESTVPSIRKISGGTLRSACRGKHVPSSNRVGDKPCGCLGQFCESYNRPTPTERRYSDSRPGPFSFAQTFSSWPLPGAGNRMHRPSTAPGERSTYAGEQPPCPPRASSREEAASYPNNFNAQIHGR